MFCLYIADRLFLEKLSVVVSLNHRHRGTLHPMQWQAWWQGWEDARAKLG